jgi:hypothetical protein
VKIFRIIGKSKPRQQTGEDTPQAAQVAPKKASSKGRFFLGLVPIARCTLQ